MAISFISSAAAAATTIATMPTHQTGDLLLMFAYRTGSTTAPTIPTGSGWTSISSGTGGGGSSNAYALAWKVATSSSEASGTWTNATHLQLQVFRGQLTSSPIGASAVTTGQSTGTTVTFPALTLAVQNNSSFVATFYGHRTNFTPPTTSPGVLTYRNGTNSAGGTSASYSTNSGVSTFSATSATISATSSNYIPVSVEIEAQPDTTYYLIT